MTVNIQKLHAKNDWRHIGYVVYNFHLPFKKLDKAIYRTTEVHLKHLEKK